MKNSLIIGEIFDILDTEINLLMDKTSENEHTGKIKSISLLLEEKIKELYRQANSRSEFEKKPEIAESRKETCICGQPWI